ncbi:hypothetical protein [Streptomyces xanthii]|uniref:Protein kinase domain-containing protein n=1 Tax=Streptomyces xanthii TaxID=2768069 RepID=A0A7H1B5B9_9ACTN|nr:hypothetical protein [Streptomyces xanthii]QNS03924.1 hypothetical protein IAG42_09995 [Streptomyces xanthii]
MTTDDFSVPDGAALTLGDGTVVTRDGEPLGQGGQGSVWAVAERAELAAKVYNRSPDEAQLRRLAAMLRVRPLADEELVPGQPPMLVWPAELVEAGGRPVGYTMTRLLPSAHVPLNGLLQKQVRLERFEGTAHWRFLLAAASNLAYMTAQLHAEGFVIGDLSSTNAFSDKNGYITLLDCDSFAFTDRLTGERFGCDVFTDDYAGPERHAGEQPSRHSDDFALAILVYQLLTAGSHPFDGAPKYGTEESTRKDNILTGTSFLIHPDRVTVPSQRISPGVLPPRLHQLACAAFGPGLRRPQRRPNSAAWLAALDEARAGVVQCATAPDHYYGGHLARCPWCARRSEGRPDPFSASSHRPRASRRATTSTRARPTASAPGAPPPRKSAPASGPKPPPQKEQKKTTGPGNAGGTKQSASPGSTGPTSARATNPRSTNAKATNTGSTSAKNTSTGATRTGATKARASKAGAAAPDTGAQKTAENGTVLGCLTNVVLLLLVVLIIWGISEVVIGLLD